MLKPAKPSSIDRQQRAYLRTARQCAIIEMARASLLVCIALFSVCDTAPTKKPRLAVQQRDGVSLLTAAALDKPVPTFLPQKSIFPLWKDGFETWHIAVFLVGMLGGNLFAITKGLIDRPTPGVLGTDAVLSVSNPVFRLFLLTTALLFAKVHFLTWAEVWWGCLNNSFSKNKWDEATGSPKVAACSTESDLRKTTFHNIHANDLENIPLALILHLLLVLVQPSAAAATLIMWSFTASRLLHTFWYAFYGSHEIRAMIFSVGAMSNYAAVCQILSACGVL